MKWSTEIYTRHVQESKDFYCKYFDFKIKLEIDGFVVLQHKKKTEYELLFCVPNSPFVNKLFHPEFEGKGILFQMEVDDVEKEYQRLKELGIKIKLPLANEPVNGKHFTVIDPNNIPIDIVELDFPSS